MNTVLTNNPGAESGSFHWADEKFADLQLLRYRVPGFEHLSLQQKAFVYYLSKAAMWGRDILFDQNGKYNLRIRRLLEAVYTEFKGNRDSEDFHALEVYLKRVWFSNGIHHHYGCDKFVPGFSEAFLEQALLSLPVESLPLSDGQTLRQLCDELFPVIFNPAVMPKRVNQADGEDLIKTSACNYYENVSQEEAETYYGAKKETAGNEPVMFGLNSRLVKENGELKEKVWKEGGLYGPAIRQILKYLGKALPFCENEKQKQVLSTLMDFYKTGDLHTFDKYSILWVEEKEAAVDFINGFIEVYGDPLGLKGSWESLVDFRDEEATRRTKLLCDHAQWFEDHSPVDARFKRTKVHGMSAKVITAAILGGDMYPSSAIGINLPNSNWIRSTHGSKSVTIGNLTHAYDEAAKGSGFREEFVFSDVERDLINKYGNIVDNLHTDLHECLGHGSGKMLPGVDADGLKAYGSTIEEARADLFGLYYLPDAKLRELGLTPADDAYKAEYYTYMMNGLMTQLVRIVPGQTIEEAHMRNRAVIAYWAYEQGKAESVVEFVQRDGKTYVKINDYEKLREIFGRLLAEIQRIKSEGDYEAARALVESYGVKVNPTLHAEVLARYKKLDIAPYKGFINPEYVASFDAAGNITDVQVRYGESFAHQMLRYSHDYAALPCINE